MLYRKIQTYIERHLTSSSDKILIVDGARQTGKSYIIRHVGKQLFANYIELNMEEDALGDRLFADVRTKEDFYLSVSVVAGNRMGGKDDTLVFIDEIQRYDHLLTLLKFLREDNRFTYIASGSLLGVTLRLTPSVPLGSIDIQNMYPLDFEEYLIACGVGREFIDAMRMRYELRKPLPDAMHLKMMNLLRKYLLCGGLPDAVNTFIEEQNIVKVREIQRQIKHLYQVDASRYEDIRGRLKIQRIYEMIPSNLENKKKRVVAKNVEGITGKRMADYQDEFDYLISSGIALEVKAVSKPAYPLVQNSGKNLLKLYMNDVGLFTATLYNNNIQPVMNDAASVNLGAVYETLVAQELKAHGLKLFYFDSKKSGEVDYIIDDSQHLSVMPIEVKSGRDYKTHSALCNLLSVEEYGIKNAFVLSNEQKVWTERGITYMPIYYVMFIGGS